MSCLVRFVLGVSTLMLGVYGTSFSQVGMGGRPDASAVLDLKSPGNNQGFLIPRLTSSQRKAITSPAVGLLVYDLDRGTLYLYDGQYWLPLTTSTNEKLSLIDRFASDGDRYDSFGASVAISGNYAVVASPNKNNKGKVYVYQRIGGAWVEKQQLESPASKPGDHFGYSVAISASYIVVGNRSLLISGVAEGSQGAAYVYTLFRGNWSLSATLKPTDGEFFDDFGASVAVYDNQIIVGAPHHTNGSGNWEGAAYVFTGSGTSWAQRAKGLASNRSRALRSEFGQSVAISGNYVLVGAPLENETATTFIGRGAAYEFAVSGSSWVEVNRFTGLVEGDHFGSSVSISGDYAIVGAPDSFVNEGERVGAVSIFFRSGSTWARQAFLRSNTPKHGDKFGISVSISGDYAIVGASGVDACCFTDQGAAYLFKRSGTNWDQVRSYTDNSPEYTQNGSAVSISDGSFIIGAPRYLTYKGKVSFGVVD